MDTSQLEHLLIYAPLNGRYSLDVYKSTLPGVKLDMTPPIQVRNVFPIDLFARLQGGPAAKYFQLSQHKIKPTGLISFMPVELALSMRDTLDNSPDMAFTPRINDLHIALTSNNSYVNALLATIGTIRLRVNVHNENRYEPKIAWQRPTSGSIVLDEGTYAREPVASVRGYDRDAGDPGRLEYFLIGSSLLDIDRSTGEVTLSGTLDAETLDTREPLRFYCYARDLAPQPFGMNSRLVEFNLTVRDVNEYVPVVQPIVYSASVRENALGSESLSALELACYDRDASANVQMLLRSVRYVSKYDSNVFIDAKLNNVNIDRAFYDDEQSMSDLFRLVFANEDTNTTRQTSYLTAGLALTRAIDYDRSALEMDTTLEIENSKSTGHACPVHTSAVHHHLWSTCDEQLAPHTASAEVSQF